MKCSRCGYKASDIAHMSAHYRKKHAAVLKAKKAKTKTELKKAAKSMTSKQLIDEIDRLLRRRA